MKKQVKCIVSCLNSNGEPDLYFIVIECTDEQYNDGDHYDAAKAQCEEDGYESYLAYDENDSAGNAMLPLFTWESATILDITG
jgi:hypothetical protein